jgi:hypothetical protein
VYIMDIDFCGAKVVLGLRVCIIVFMCLKQCTCSLAILLFVIPVGQYLYSIMIPPTPPTQEKLKIDSRIGKAGLL